MPLPIEGDLGASFTGATIFTGILKKIMFKD
jgi:hypothetical protein